MNNRHKEVLSALIIILVVMFVGCCVTENAARAEDDLAHIRVHVGQGGVDKANPRTVITVREVEGC